MHAVSSRDISIRLACKAFGISQACYRYVGRRNAENDEIANWLLRLTDNPRNWGFGLCFLYLRNVKGFGWNHKRVYRIYRELELNLRIKPRSGWSGRYRSRWRYRAPSTRSGRWTSCTTNWPMDAASGCST